MTLDLIGKIHQLDTPIGPVWSVKDDVEHMGVIDEVIVRDTYRVRELAESGFKPRTIVDLGANIGTFTLMASHYFPKARIFSFEPNAGHFEFLALNCSAKATLLRVAVLGCPKIPHLMREEELMWLKSGLFISMLSVRELAGTPDYIKMDVEGSEKNILIEMVDIGMVNWVSMVVGEWHHQPARKAVELTLAPTHDVTFGPADRGYEWDTFHAFHRQGYPDRCKT